MDGAAARRLGPADLVALAATGGVLLLLLAPGARRLAARSDRAACAENLRAIGAAAIAYMASPVGPAGRKGFMPHAGALDAPDRPAQVGEAFAMLVRTGDLDDPKTLVCPSSTDLPLELEGDRKKFRIVDPDIRSSNAFSYGWAKDQRTDGNSKADAPISADRTVGDPGGGFRGHDGGRNVLRFDGGVSFVDAEAERKSAELQAALDGLNLLHRLYGEEEEAKEAAPPAGADPAPAEAVGVYREGVDALGAALAAWAEGVAQKDAAKARVRFEAAKESFDTAIAKLRAVKRVAPGLDPSIDELIFLAARYGVACREKLAVGDAEPEPEAEKKD